MSFTKFGKFSAIISSKKFFLYHPYPSQDFNDTNVGLEKNKSLGP